ncbi:hypothetical protein [Cohnella sp. 56]|uniref:hypothetical protein n=1 Tax=Cohnella sp. 56 TaxID=3113722 RepID=UPI0030E7E6C6
MRIIKTQQDFDVLRGAGALPAALLDRIEEYFHQLRDEQEDEDSNDFCLDKCGYIVILETGDNVLNLGNVGLNREDGGRRVCSSNSVRADLVESIVFERIAQAFQKPKVLEDVVTKINKDRALSIVPLERERASIDKELSSIKSQRDRFFKLFEASSVDEDLFLERLSELKEWQERLLTRRSEIEGRLEDNVSEPVPLQQVRKALTQFHKLLKDSPPETQKKLLHTPACSHEGPEKGVRHRA